MKNFKVSLVALTLSASSLAAPTLATDYAIYVAPRDSVAEKTATGKANDTQIFAERTLHRALTKAGELLAKPGQNSVRVLVAAGQYKGKAGQGVWKIPTIANPQGRLYVLGGMNDEFTGRQPFGNLTELVTVSGRDGALLQFGSKSQLKEAVISGFLLDAAPSNDYDAKTNSLKKATSRSYPLMSFAMLATDHLAVADNIFLNGAHGAFDPFVTRLSANSTIDITNNFFLNNIKALKARAV